MTNTIDFCFLENYSDLEHACKKCFLSSKNQIKKYLGAKQRHLKVMAQKQYTLPIDLVNFLVINPNYTGLNINIIDENENFIVLEKPSLIHCFPQSYCETDNCLSYLRKKNKLEALNINKENYDRGLLYRLDYETSGVLVLAKNLNCYQYVRENSSSSFIKKLYYALVHGHVPENEKLSHELSGSMEKGKKTKVSQEKTASSKKCTLEYKKIEYFEKHDMSLIEIHLGQGYRHQIRAQLAYRGFPLVGDGLYGKTEYLSLMLHAHTYALEWQGENFQWSSLISSDQWLKASGFEYSG
ncbi:MAG: RNA pseudouridine synthase [Halobacteriovoraceae bacterium]|nr:RNA pseudouridine synthase [Halobacteriovoraceae bacterium]MCB9095411.1 RNA pseudouridine synthase [Halobacteriovoraceae bacterium]